jgi:hypothetical protein
MISGAGDRYLLELPNIKPQKIFALPLPAIAPGAEAASTFTPRTSWNLV